MMMKSVRMMVRMVLSGVLLAGTLAVMSVPVADAKPAHAKGHAHKKQQHVYQKSAPWQEFHRFQVKNDKRDKEWRNRDWRNSDRRNWDDDHRKSHYRGDWDRRHWNDRDRNRFRDWLGDVQGRRYRYNGNVPRDVLRRYGMSRAEFESLPPGIQKNVLRGKPLPPGHAKKLGAGYRLNRTELGRVNPITDSIRDALGMPRNYYDYSDGRRVGRYGNDAILYNPNSGIITDVLSGIFN